MAGELNEKLLDEQLGNLEKARSWSPRLMSKLEALLRAPDDLALYRLNPLAFAAERNVAPAEAVDLFLHAARAGLFQMRWQLLCPGCGEAVESFGSLHSVGSAYHCTLCRVDLQASLDDCVEVSFTVSPPVRSIRYHNPDSLDVKDWHRNVRQSAAAEAADGSGVLRDLLDPATVLLTFVPHGRTEVDMKLGEGFITGGDPLNHGEFFVPVQGTHAGVETLELRMQNGRYLPLTRPSLTAGAWRVVVDNDGDQRGVLALYNLPANYAPGTVQFRPFLTGAMLLSNQTFRDLFRTETIRANEGLGVRDVSVLFTDLKGSTALYDRVGDLNAFALVQQHFDRLGKVIQANDGAVVKTIGDAIMATFRTPPDAVRAAFQMLDEIEGFNREHGDRELILKIGVHRGASIAVTLNDRLDYFGQTVNIAARVQNLADADEVYLTHEVFSHPGVAPLLAGQPVVPHEAKLKGVRGEMRVYQVTYNLGSGGATARA